MRKDSANTLLKEGMLFDVNILDAERQRITDNLLRTDITSSTRITFHTADTVRNTYLVDLTLHLQPYTTHADDTPKPHNQYFINK